MSLVACSVSGSGSGGGGSAAVLPPPPPNCCCSWPSRLALVGLFTRAVAILVVNLTVNPRPPECAGEADPPGLDERRVRRWCLERIRLPSSGHPLRSRSSSRKSEIIKVDFNRKLGAEIFDWSGQCFRERVNPSVASLVREVCSAIVGPC